ncbi:hypothetical protein CGCSCA4_v013717 [Colletotrichum siamense]|uniref:Uncharacterized protein n=1 Tax=Colletotrichum siamense TaxID=690259 RepID=A0A9P5BN76_COLSI|nr:hypothetical protein CGCSCA4_v013717 [Colletotrichum siamense]KAF4845167.1 hypothetical protein CGCSCA2_v013653 [Colletotrichum siamense]
MSLRSGIEHVLEAIQRTLHRIRYAFDSVVNWIRIAYSHSPYYRGNVIYVHRLEKDDRQVPQAMTLIIQRVFQSHTWNVMEVYISNGPPDIPKRAVLKMFDRRFSTMEGRHAFIGEGKWSPEFEQEFISYIRRRKADEFAKEWLSGDFSSDTKPNKLQLEVVRHLEHVRASQIQEKCHRNPAFLDCATFPELFTPVVINFGAYKHPFLRAYGVLMRYQEGFSAQTTSPLDREYYEQMVTFKSMFESEVE